MSSNKPRRRLLTQRSYDLLASRAQALLGEAVPQRIAAKQQLGTQVVATAQGKAPRRFGGLIAVATALPQRVACQLLLGRQLPWVVS